MMEFEGGFIYTCLHIPTNENWYVLGVDPSRDRLCVAGYPATMAKISDCTNFVKLKEITDEELAYRRKAFGTTWI